MNCRRLASSEEVAFVSGHMSIMLSFRTINSACARTQAHRAAATLAMENIGVKPTTRSAKSSSSASKQSNFFFGQKRHLSSASKQGRPTRQRFIDLSISIENEDVSVSDPPVMIPTIEYINHKDSVPMLQSFFEGLTPEDLPDGEAWAIEKVQLTTHNGTHLDAPYHFHSTTKCDQGINTVKAKTIDEIPLEWCFSNGVKLDFRHFEDGYIVQPDDMERELDRIEYAIQPMDIVVVNTSAGQAYGTPAYLNSGCGMGRDATLWLLEKGVKITGTDAWSWVSK
jgi:kynurenine formamidase